MHSSARQGSRAARSGPYADDRERHDDGGGGAGADVRLPMAVQRRPAGMTLYVAVFQDGADHSRRRDEQRCGEGRGRMRRR
ncbi:hypothetical protein AQJ46_37865 [Streptomyces canus]|uniref:Uncharacterized protein n=1 Tax=Streptomyces canus TaxID=58343 RepID=A0A101RRH9_9ACTN|nr:hypothetical protein AQJ46_37865 [Streptomyces canus]